MLVTLKICAGRYPSGQLQALYLDKFEIYIQWLYLIGSGIIPTKVYFQCAKPHTNSRGYNACPYKQSKTDVRTGANFVHISMNVIVVEKQNFHFNDEEGAS